jgi:hypothetical protein
MVKLKSLLGSSRKFLPALVVSAVLVLLPGTIGATPITAGFELGDLSTVLSIEVNEVSEDTYQYQYSFSPVQTDTGWEIVYISIGYGYDGDGSRVRPASYGIGDDLAPNPPGNQEGAHAILLNGSITIEDAEDINATHVIVTLGEGQTSLDPFYIQNPQPLDYQNIWVTAEGPPQLFMGWLLTPDATDSAKAEFPSSVPVPEPGTLLLLGVALMSLGLLARRKKG